MRTTGIVAHLAGRAKTASGGGAWVKPLAVVLLLVAAVGVTWFVTRSSMEGGQENAPTPEQTVSAEGVNASLPEDLRFRPDEVTSAVTAAAKALEGDPTEIVAAVAKARASGHLPSRAPDSMQEVPRAAEQLAPSLSGTPAIATASFELATLSHALLTAKGHSAIEYGLDVTPKGAATDVTFQHYYLRVNAGPWLSAEGNTPPDTVTPLSASQFMAHVLAWRGVGAFMADDTDFASRAVNYALKLAPDDPAFTFLSGQIKLRTGLAEMGLSEMQSAASRRSDAKTWLHLGVAAIEVNQPFRAHQNLVKSTDLDPLFVEPHLMLAQLAMARFSITPKEEHQKLLDQIKGHVTDAEAIEDEAMGIRIIKAQLSAMAEDMEGAEALLREELSLHSDSEVARAALVQLLHSLDKKPEAMALLKDARSTGAISSELLKMLAAMQVEAGQNNSALETLEEALASEPKDPELRPQLAQLYKQSGSQDKARALLTQQLESFPQDFVSRLLFAQLEMDAGNHEKANGYVEEALKIQPQMPEALVLHYLVGVAIGRDVDTRRRIAVRALGKPSDLGQILMEQGVLAEAEKVLLLGVAEHPDDVVAPVMLAALYVVQGKDAQAEALKAEQVSSAPEDERANLDKRFQTAMDDAREAIQSQQLQAP